MEFAAAREALASLHRETPIATLLCEPESLRIVACNPAAEALLGYDESEIGAVPWTALVASSQAVVDALREALAGHRNLVRVDIVPREGAPVSIDLDAFGARAGERIAGAFVHLRPAPRTLSDPLTGLPSQALLDDRIDQALRAARRYDYRFALIAADIDGFGSITARYGAAAGDWILRVVAQRVRDALRRSDTVVHGVRDRFVVLQPMIESIDDAVDLAHKVVFAMHAPITIDGDALDVRMSLGIAAFPLDGETREELTLALEAALREAKQHARGLFRLATKSSLEPAT